MSSSRGSQEHFKTSDECQLAPPPDDKKDTLKCQLGVSLLLQWITRTLNTLKRQLGFS
ncbi:hypothetical protein ACLOJK_033481 [Asimina triloba]